MSSETKVYVMKWRGENVSQWMLRSDSEPLSNNIKGHNGYMRLIKQAEKGHNSTEG